jgi:cell division inhibitor SepF
MAVTDLWHRTLVYFGMADEPDDYADEYDDDDPDRRGYEREQRDRDRENRSSASDDLERTYRERPNVRRLGPRRRDADFDDIFADDTRTSSRPVMRSVETRPQPAEVYLVVPKSFNDAQQIADKFKGTIPVILNLQSAETDLAKRLIDFSSGLTYALDGGMQRVADKVFMLTPRNVEVSAEERARLLEKGFFNQY